MADLKYQVLLDESAVAAEDLEKYAAVVIDGNGKAALPAAGDKIAGVVLERYGQDERVRIVSDGKVPIIVGTAAGINKGDYLEVDANGHFQAGTGTSGNAGAAIAREAPGADGDIINARISELIDVTF